MLKQEEIERVEGYLSDHLKQQKDGSYIIDCYWDYRDELSSETMDELLGQYAKYHKDGMTLENIVEDYIIEKGFDIDPTYQVINDILEEYSELDRDDVIDHVFERVAVNLRIDDLLNNSIPEDLTLYFGTCWDDDYHTHSDWQDDEPDMEMLSETPLGWLVKTQGYIVEDVFDETKRKASPFLKDVYEEVFSYVTDLSGMQLVAVPKSSDWEAIARLKAKEPGVVLDKGVLFGLFNRIHGSGSGLSIVTEKPIVIDETSPLYDVFVSRKNDYYDYSPDAVYGLYIDAGDQLHIK